MKKPHFFKKILLSMSSKPFYKTILHEHFMKSILYLLLFSLIISLPFSIYSSLKTSNLITLISTDFPTFSLSKGELKLENNEPFIYKDSDKMIFIVDTSGTYGLNDLAGYEKGLLMTSKSIIIPQLGFKPQIIKYSEFPYLTFSTTDLDLLVLLQPLFVFVSVLILVFLTLFINAFKSLFCCSIAFFIKNSFGLPLTFTQTYKVAIYCMTLPLVFVEILKFIPSPLASNISFGFFILVNVITLVQIFNHMKNEKTDISI